jgi:hypothetical protein
MTAKQNLCFENFRYQRLAVLLVTHLTIQGRNKLKIIVIENVRHYNKISRRYDEGSSAIFIKQSGPKSVIRLVRYTNFNGIQFSH